MKVLVVGGGSGGHITPAVAVVREILKQKPRTRVEFWTDRKYYKNVVKITTEIGVSWGEESKLSGKRKYIQVRKIFAGKFHRYAGWKLKNYIERFDITFKDLFIGNIVGFFGFILGLIQSFIRMFPRKKRPDVIFLKGGFVGLPVGLVARLLKIPYVVHESDVVPGLANRLLMKRAKIVAMGVPFEMPELEDDADVDEVSDEVKQKRAIYEARKNWKFVGIPVAPEFKKVSEAKQRSLKKTFGFDPDRPLVVMTGGSQGAQNMNEAMREVLPEMLKFTSVGLVAGRKHYEDMVDLKKYEDWEKAKLVSDFRMWAFNSAMDELLGAADLVISRAGATTIAELAALEKAVILVPFERLPGAHQVKNAERLVSLKACTMIGDERLMAQPGLMVDLSRKLIRSPRVREGLAKNLHDTVNKPHAAEELAEMVLRVGVEEK